MSVEWARSPLPAAARQRHRDFSLLERRSSARLAVAFLATLAEDIGLARGVVCSQLWRSSPCGTLLAGFIVLGALRNAGAAQVLPVILYLVLSLARTLGSQSAGQWFWADSRQQLSGDFRWP